MGADRPNARNSIESVAIVVPNISWVNGPVSTSNKVALLNVVAPRIFWVRFALARRSMNAEMDASISEN